MGILFSGLLLLAPLYIWRFSAFGFPLNALLVLQFIVIGISLIWVIYRNQWLEFKAHISQLPKTFIWLSFAFLIAGTLSLLVGGFTIPKLGQWLVWFAQPMATFLLLNFFISQSVKIKEQLEFTMYLFVGLAGILAIVQYTTLFGLPVDWWGNSNEPKRAIAFFVHPNGFALFLTPLMAWLIPGTWESVNNFWKKRNFTDLVCISLWKLGGIGLLLSLSRGAWLGFAVACIVFAFASRNRKVIYATLIAGMLAVGLVFAVPNLRYRVLLPFMGEKSTVARFSLWNTGWKMVKDNPLMGKGINGFNYNWERYNNDPNLQHYNFPHNWLLNFWIDTGLLGMVSFAGILLYIFWTGIISRSRWQLSTALFVIALATHGLIDIPYLKNDLALLFWMTLALNDFG